MIYLTMWTRLTKWRGYKLTGGYMLMELHWWCEQRFFTREGKIFIVPRGKLLGHKKCGPDVQQFSPAALYYTTVKSNFLHYNRRKLFKKFTCAAIYKATRVYLYWSATSANINFKLFTRLHKRLTWILEHRRRENFDILTAYTKDLHIYF